MKGVNISFRTKRKIRTPLILIIVLLVFSSSAAIAHTQVKGAVSQIPGVKIKMGKLQGIFNKLMAMQGAISAVAKEISVLISQLAMLREKAQNIMNELQALRSQLRSHKLNKPKKPNPADFPTGGELNREAYNAAMNNYNQSSARWQSDLNSLIQRIRQTEKKLQDAKADIKKAQNKVEAVMRKLREMEKEINKLQQQALQTAQSAQSDPTLSSQQKAEILSKYRKIKLLSNSLKQTIKKHLAGKRTLIPPKRRLKRQMLT